MDDIDTRLQTERPEVADALKSMNWEERLEEARLRRKAVLKAHEKAGKRPVVRIVDAAAMAQRRAGVLEPSSDREPEARIVRPPPPLHEMESPALSAAPEEPVRATALPVAAPARDQPSVAGRTALGFGLGLGLGTSIVAAIFFLFVLPDATAISARDATSPVTSIPVAAAPVATVPVESAAAAAPPEGIAPAATPPVVSMAAPASTAAPASELGELVRPASVADTPTRGQLPAQPAALAVDARSEARAATVPTAALSLPGIPAVAAAAPAPVAEPVEVIDYAVVPASVAVPALRPQAPAQFSALSSDAVPSPAAPLRAPAVAPLGVALAEAAISPNAVAASLPDAGDIVPRIALLTGTPAVSRDAVPGWEGSFPRPAEGIAPAVIADSPVAAERSLLPLRFVAPLPVALPAQPAPAAGPEGTFNVALAPPAPLPPPSVTGGPSIPNGEALFVRIAVPETVPEEEAGELAGLLQEVGIGDGRISRVGFKVSETHIRFYRAEDAEAASALGEIIGTEARDFTSFRPSPPDGTLEIFLAGDRTSPAPRAAAPKRARSQPPDDLTRMRDRIVNRLRRGEHL